MDTDPLYQESLFSTKTFLLFLTLSCICSCLWVWRALTVKFDLLVGLFVFLDLFFTFYTFNYRRLDICLTYNALQLKFGLFRWRVPLDNIASYKMDDDLSPLMRYGGAGIHFMFINGRYRASYNFLEYPRVVISFKRKVGPAKELSFSTNQPYNLLAKLGKAVGR